MRQGCCLISEHYQAIKKLKQMIELKFLKHDKGPGVVIMTKDVYKSKMNQILMNKDKFHREETPDNNHFTECPICRKLQILLLHGHISEAQYRRLKPMEVETAYMRQSPKFHKPGVPLGPTLCMQNSPYHKLVCW